MELVALHANLAQVGIENAELIASLNESGRALAASYERMEQAYQELQAAQAALRRQERQGALEGLFLKMTQRLSGPVQRLNEQSQRLEHLLEVEAAGVEVCEEAFGAVRELRLAVGIVDGLLKGLERRVRPEAKEAPERLVLHEVISQELELLEAEGALPEGAWVSLDLQAQASGLMGVYGDFARLLLLVLQHACGEGGNAPVIRLRSRTEGETFVLEVEDEGGAIPDGLLEQAFEPFSGLHQQPVLGVRTPGVGLPHARQILEPYGGSVTIVNEGEGTRLTVRIPLHQG